jgi:hypothetical protein
LSLLERVVLYVIPFISVFAGVFAGAVFIL